MLKVCQNGQTRIAAHRGTFGGNIIQNTIAAFDNALLHGADIIELDVVLSKDGVFYIFHDGYEKEVLGINQHLKHLTSAQIDQLVCTNAFEQASGVGLSRLEDVLEHFRGRALINVDRSWHNWKEIISFLDKHQAHDFCMLKSPVHPQLLEQLAASKSNLMYVPIVKSVEEYHQVREYDVNLVGVELIFGSLEDALVQPTMMKHFKDSQLFTWVNAIDLGKKYNLSAHLTDTGAITEGFDQHWGKLIDLGFDILQTDWPMLLRSYILTRKKGKGNV